MRQDHWLTSKFIGLLIVVLSICLFSCSGAEEREAKYLKRADKYFSEKNYDKAKVEIKNVLQINPKNAKARLLLGRLNQKDGDYRQAIANFNTAVEEDKSQIDARLEMAKIYLSASKDAEATQFIKEVLSLDANNSEGQAIMAGLHMRAGERDKAIEMANGVLRTNSGNLAAIAVLAAIYIDSDPQLALTKINEGLLSDTKSMPLKLLKIQVLQNTKRSDETPAIYLELIKDNPKTLSLYDKLAGNYTYQGKIDEAEAIVRLAIDNNPDVVDPILALVNFTKKMRSPEKSEAMLKEFIVKKPDLYILKQTLAGQYYQENRKAEAIKLLNSVVASNGANPDSLRARVDLARFYLLDKDMTKAIALLDEVFAIEPSNAEARILSARIKISDNKIKDAIADLRTVIKSDGKSLEAYKLLAYAQERDGSAELALDSYFHALDIDSQDIPSLFGAARLNIQKKQNETGKKLLTRILGINPGNLEASVLLTNLLIGNKDWQEAEKLSQALIDSTLPANKATGFDLLGGVYSAQGKWSLAKQNYEKSLALSPTSYGPLAGLVNALLAESKTTEAVALLEGHINSYPDFNRAKNLLAHLYVKEKKIKPAVAIYESLLQQEPNNESLYQSLAAVYFEQKNVKKAEDIYLTGLTVNPESASLRAYLGNLYAFDKQYAKAKEQYEIANSKMPDSDMVKNNLAILLVNYLPSEKNTRRALDLTLGFSNSKEASYLDTLGWVHYQAGNTPQAISFLQQSVGIKQSPETRYHLGMAYQKNGQLEDAKKELTHAIHEMKGEAEWLESAQKALAGK